MSSYKGKLVVRRILVPLDESPHSRAALEAATTLAAALESEISGLYVEDSDLLELTRYPFFREVCSYEHRPLRTDALERDFRLQAERIRRLMARLAGSAEVAWSFDVRRGCVRTVIQEQTGTADLTVLGRIGRTMLRSTMGSTVRHLIAHGRGMTLILQEGLRLTPPIMAVYTGSDLSDRALEVAVNLAIAAGGLLEILLPAKDRESFVALKKEAEAAMPDTDNVQVMFHPIRLPAVRGLIDRLQSAFRQPVVLPADAADGRPEDLMQLLDRINNPVLIVRE